MTKDKKHHHEEQHSAEEAGEQLPPDETAELEEPQSGNSFVEEPVEETSEDECAKLQLELAAVKDSMLRRQADFDNYKKRMVKLQEDNRKYAIKEIASDVVQINDDLLRAIEASTAFKSDEKTAQEAYDSFVQGVTMISKSIESVLQKYGVVEIDAMDREFDPNLHEAIEIEASPDVQCDMVTKVHRKGFMMNDMVLRSAQVKVTKPEKKEG